MFRLLSGHPQIKRVRTKINLAWPFHGSLSRNSNLLKNARRFPCRAYATANKLRQFDHAALTVVELQFKPIAGQCLRFRDFHTMSLLPTIATVDAEAQSIILLGMGILIGMDEAGYGPNLGPLVVAATAWH